MEVPCLFFQLRLRVFMSGNPQFHLFVPACTYPKELRLIVQLLDICFPKG